jgi:hypothetical protein
MKTKNNISANEAEWFQASLGGVKGWFTKPHIYENTVPGNFQKWEIVIAEADGDEDFKLVFKEAAKEEEIFFGTFITFVTFVNLLMLNNKDGFASCEFSRKDRSYSLDEINDIETEKEDRLSAENATWYRALLNGISGWFAQQRITDASVPEGFRKWELENCSGLNLEPAVRYGRKVTKKLMGTFLSVEDLPELEKNQVTRHFSFTPVPEKLSDVLNTEKDPQEYAAAKEKSTDKPIPILAKDAKWYPATMKSLAGWLTYALVEESSLDKNFRKLELAWFKVPGELNVSLRCTDHVDTRQERLYGTFITTDDPLPENYVVRSDEITDDNHSKSYDEILEAEGLKCVDNDGKLIASLGVGFYATPKKCLGKDGVMKTDCSEICTQNECCDECPIQEAFDRLAAYEATGLLPDDIEDLKRKSDLKKLQKKIKKQKKKIKKLQKRLSRAAVQTPADDPDEYVIAISFSWGEEEPPIPCGRSEKDAWEKAKELATKEAETASAASRKLLTRLPRTKRPG